MTPKKKAGTLAILGLICIPFITAMTVWLFCHGRPGIALFWSMMDGVWIFATLVNYNLWRHDR